MKNNHYLFSILSVLLIFLQALASEGIQAKSKDECASKDTTLIHLGKFEDGTPTGRPRHAPTNYSFLPNAWIDNGILYFEGTTDIPFMHVSIEDKNGIIVLSTDINIQEGCLSFIDLSELPELFYTLYIKIEELTYYSDITI